MEETKTTALRTLRMLFQPIAQILLRAGVNWKELVEVCKATYVEVATNDFGIRGRPTNVSRVSILTGFSRSEVRRLRAMLGEEALNGFDRMNSATRVLTGWHSDEDFVDETGSPRPLDASGCNPSFETLCSRYGGDVRATTMLKELRHVGAIAAEADGRLVAKTRYYMPALTDPEQMLRSGSVFRDVGDTVTYNLHRDADDPSRFERRATNTQIPESAVPAFREFIEKEGQAFLERVDAWLSDHEDDQAKKHVRLGLGAYLIEEDHTDRQSP